MERRRIPRFPAAAFLRAALLGAALAAGPGVSALGVTRSLHFRAGPYRLAAAADAPGPAPAAAPALPLSLPSAALPQVVRQSTPRSCGAAALATVLAWQGRPVGESVVLGRARLRADGVSLAELARLAAAFELPAAWYALPPRDLRRLPTPFIAHLRTAGGHYVAVARVGRGFVMLADPAVGLTLMRLGRFRRSWSGRVLVFRRAAGGAS